MKIRPVALERGVVLELGFNLLGVLEQGGVADGDSEEAGVFGEELVEGLVAVESTFGQTQLVNHFIPRLGALVAKAVHTLAINWK